MISSQVQIVRINLYNNVSVCHHCVDQQLIPKLPKTHNSPCLPSSSPILPTTHNSPSPLLHLYCQQLTTLPPLFFTYIYCSGGSSQPLTSVSGCVSVDLGYRHVNVPLTDLAAKPIRTYMGVSCCPCLMDDPCSTGNQQALLQSLTKVGDTSIGGTNHSDRRHCYLHSI